MAYFEKLNYYLNVKIYDYQIQPEEHQHYVG